jgi:MJ0042 family finger-like protein
MISKYEALQDEINNQPALGQQRLKAMLRFLQDGQVSDSEITKVLTYEYKGKTEEQTELYNILVGLVIDLYVKNNGQEKFLELYKSFQGEPEQEQVEPVEEKEEKNEPTEGNSTIIAPQHTDRTPKAVAPRKRMRLASPKPKEEVQKPIEEPVEATEPIVSEEVVEVEEVKEQPVATKPIEPVTYVEPEPEIEEELEDTEADISDEDDNEDETDVEVDLDELDEEEEVEKRKKNGILKYIAVGVPTLLAIGGLAFWQVNTNSKNTSLAEQEVAKIMEEAPKKEEKGAGLSSVEFENNVNALTTAFDTIKQNDKTGLTGYFTFENKRYLIQKYDQSTGSLTVFDAKGEKVVYDDEWVQKFIENSKAKLNKPEKKEEQTKKSDDSSKKDDKKKSDSSEAQTEKKEGSN